MLTRSLATPLAIALAIVLAACGGRATGVDDDGAVNPDSGPAPAPDVLASDSARATDLLSPGEVTIIPDRSQAGPTELVNGTVLNGKSERIWHGGCGMLSREERVEDKWIDRGQEVMCGWEGYAQPIDPGQTRDEQMRFSRPGTWRLALTYGVGCDPKQPLSEQHCKALFRAHSAPIVVSATLEDCQRLEKEYAKAFESARRCTSDLTIPQCTKLVSSGLSCGCPTYVNNDKPLQNLFARWSSWGCPQLSPPCGIKCASPVPAACLEDRCSPMGD